MAVSAFVLMFGYGILAVAIEAPQPANQGGKLMDALVPIFVAVSITWIVGFGLCGLATARALWLSLRYRIKLWIDPRIHEARRESIWPPSVVARGSNRAGRLVVTTLFLIYFPAMFAGIIALATQMQGARPEEVAGACMVGIIIGPILMLTVRDVMAKRVLARSPDECWAYEE
jgi:hypothetical protein